MPFCKKCQLEEEDVEATHHCPLCSTDFCESHVTLHNSSNKTKDHAPSVKPLGGGNLCAKCLKEEEEEREASHQCNECNLKLCDLHAQIHLRNVKFSSHDVKLMGVKEVPFSGKFERVGQLGDQEDLVFNFKSPIGLAVDTKNKLIFVADSCYERKIHVFDLQTKKLRYSFAPPYRPHHIAVDMNDDSLVIVSKEDHYIVKMSLDGQELIWKFGGSENKSWKEEGKLSDPMGVVIDQKDGSIYITNRGRNSVQIFSKDGKFIRELGGKFNVTSVELSDPVGIDLDQEGNLVIANNGGHTITTYSKKGQLIKTFGTRAKGNPLGQVNGPTHAIIEKCTGTMYIADSYNYRIQISKANGGTRAFGSEGKREADQFGKIEAIAINPLAGELYVADTGNSRVTIFK